MRERALADFLPNYHQNGFRKFSQMIILQCALGNHKSLFLSKDSITTLNEKYWQIVDCPEKIEVE